MTEPPAAGDTLDLIPRSVRDKLDRIGVKLHLKEWQAMHLSERQLLCDLPCDRDSELARFAAEVDRAVRRLTGGPATRLSRDRGDANQG